MKLNVLYITFAIGFLSHSSQAAPLLGDVANVSGDRLDVPAGGVHVSGDGIDVNDQDSLLTNVKRQDTHLVDGTVSDAEKLVQDTLDSPEGVAAPLSGTGQFAGKTVSDLGVSQLKRRSGSSGDVVGNLGGTIEGALGGLRKRSLQSDYSTGSNGGLVDGLLGKRDGSNDDDGEDLIGRYPPNGATYGSGMAANNPAAFVDAMTKRGSEDEEGGDDESHGENNQDHPGPPPPGLTDEQLDDYFTKRDDVSDEPEPSPEEN